MCGNLTAPLDIWGGLVEEFIFNIQQNRKNKESCYYVWFRQWTRRLLNPIMLNLNSEGKLDSFFAVSWATSIKKDEWKAAYFVPTIYRFTSYSSVKLELFPSNQTSGTLNKKLHDKNLNLSQFPWHNGLGFFFYLLRSAVLSLVKFAFHQSA